ncbi:hypothetical protein [Limosilactobacillus sp.]|uniref:hypothetical protein n=1 Tax=Limosilactobacillus sp. TaxID=2773925 RepID=UPI0035A0F2DE
MSNAKEINYNEIPTIFNTIEDNNTKRVLLNKQAVIDFVCALGTEYFGQMIFKKDIIKSWVSLVSGKFTDWERPFGTADLKRRSSRVSAIIQTNAKLNVEGLINRTTKLIN